MVFQTFQSEYPVQLFTISFAQALHYSIWVLITTKAAIQYQLNWLVDEQSMIQHHFTCFEVQFSDLHYQPAR
jgi:hypothetical protein